MFSKKLLMVAMNTRYLYSLFLLILTKCPILNIKIIAAASIKKIIFVRTTNNNKILKKLIFLIDVIVVNIFVFINLRISST
jgi:hypothetical protein